MADPSSSFRVEREVRIAAPPAVVFRFLEDPARFAEWFGAGSTIAATPGGALQVVYPGGTTAVGEVLEVEPDRRIVFTWGYPRENSPLPPGSSRVEITLEPVAEGTRVRLVHTVRDDATREAHVAGWRFYLSLLATAALRLAHGSAIAAHADTWFAAWSERDAGARRQTLASICTADCTFADQHAALAGLDDIVAHISAAQQHMPAAGIRRRGEPLLAGGCALIAWEVLAADGSVVASGHNLHELAPDGRFRRIVGFAPPPPGR